MRTPKGTGAPAARPHSPAAHTPTCPLPRLQGPLRACGSRPAAPPPASPWPAPSSRTWATAGSCCRAWTSSSSPPTTTRRVRMDELSAGLVLGGGGRSPRHRRPPRHVRGCSPPAAGMDACLGLRGCACVHACACACTWVRMRACVCAPLHITLCIVVRAVPKQVGATEWEGEGAASSVKSLDKVGQVGLHPIRSCAHCCVHARARVSHS